jgi:hypothetical protein
MIAVEREPAREFFVATAIRGGGLPSGCAAAGGE